MAKKGCKFEESLIFAEGWTEEEWNSFCEHYYRFKIGNNIKLSQAETNHYIEVSEHKPVIPDRVKELEEENRKLKKALEEIKNKTYDNIAYEVAKGKQG